MHIEQFANINFLWGLLVLLPMVGLYVWRLKRGATAAITISTAEPVAKMSRTWRYWFRHLPFVLLCLAVLAIIIALARPQNAIHGSSATTEGIDIVLAVDVSTSMLARDFEPDRITAAKDVASRFVADRQRDRIGVVVFSAESFTLCPVTTDHNVLLGQLSSIKAGMLQDGTAIGSGLATSVNRLKESDAISKVVILLTDGVNNAGQIAPLTAADIAAEFGIRVYTIGVGTRGTALAPAQDMWGRIVFAPTKVEIDEELLTQIAERTGGQYFRATDKQTLVDVYSQIDQLERTRMETSEFVLYDELGVYFMITALVLLVLGQCLKLSGIK